MIHITEGWTKWMKCGCAQSDDDDRQPFVQQKSLSLSSWRELTLCIHVFILLIQCSLAPQTYTQRPTTNQKKTKFQKGSISTHFPLLRMHALLRMHTISLEAAGGGAHSEPTELNFKKNDISISRQRGRQAGRQAGTSDIIEPAGGEDLRQISSLKTGHVDISLALIRDNSSLSSHARPGRNCWLAPISRAVCQMETLSLSSQTKE